MSLIAVLATSTSASAASTHSHRATSTRAHTVHGQLAGTHWTLIRVRGQTKSYGLPRGYRAKLNFDLRGRFTGLDGINGLDGNYNVARNKLTIRATAVGTAGGTGTFPAQEAMLSVYSPDRIGQDSVTSTYKISGATLTIITKHWTLVFSREK